MSVEASEWRYPPITAGLVAQIGRERVAPHAAECDALARFPHEGVSALAEAGLLALEGAPVTTTDLAMVARTLGRSCGSTAMVWAMHYVQVACVQRHCEDEPRVLELLAKLREGGGVMASVTSEKGIGGDLRRSFTACVTEGETSTVSKDASTISYGAHADAFLITCRRDPDAVASDQVIVVADKSQVTLTPQGTWDPMGMRGTCSPPFLIEATVPSAQVLPVPFSDIAALTMVPLSHILWSGVWLGLAEEALSRATTFLRAKRKTNRADDDRRLALAETPLRLVRNTLASVIDRYDNRNVVSIDADFTVELNDLKLAASTLSIESAQMCLEILGIPGYQERTPFSVARIIRDLYSARLMIANERLVATNSTLLMLNRSH
ncbi:MAG TPA: acyl-CoA dehydrogenase family protein [Solirubrobacteraceae bacterium]|nr:acyl-CoA dehydrogenase family protein [Solirubrobacteraceae bacterium]